MPLQGYRLQFTISEQSLSEGEPASYLIKTKEPASLEDVPSQDVNKNANLLYTIDPEGIICMFNWTKVVYKDIYSRCATIYGKCRLLR